MRPRFKTDVVCSATPSGKCFFNKAIQLPKKKKTPYIKCFSKLMPVSIKEAMSLVATHKIVML